MSSCPVPLFLCVPWLPNPPALDPPPLLPFVALLSLSTRRRARGISRSRGRPTGARPCSASRTSTNGTLHRRRDGHRGTRQEELYLSPPAVLAYSDCCRLACVPFPLPAKVTQVNSNNFIGGEREAHGLLVDLAKKYMKGDSRAEIESYKKNAMITMGARLEGVGTFPLRPSPVYTLSIPPICPLPV
eukprot:8461896-Pyramimonas_sp.AAC.1